MKRLLRIAAPFEIIVIYFPYMLAGAIIDWIAPNITIFQLIGLFITVDAANYFSSKIKEIDKEK